MQIRSMERKSVFQRHFVPKEFLHSLNNEPGRKRKKKTREKKNILFEFEKKNCILSPRGKSVATGTRALFVGGPIKLDGGSLERSVRSIHPKQPDDSEEDFTICGIVVNLFGS